MTMPVFHPLVQDWFTDRFGAPTEPQRLGWPSIAAGTHTLIAAPTGSGKTLAAFLVCIDRLWRDWTAGELADGIQVVYVSPLKALSNDIERNLQAPLAELRERAAARGETAAPIRTGLRTGDTPTAARQAMLKKPPHLLVTTPESLYLLLTSPKSRELLRSVRTVIVDEIHALARDKRGSHLALTLERLAALCDVPPTRIGLSATQRPIDEIARFLVGSQSEEVHVVDTGHVRELDLAIEVPPSELSAVCSHEQWEEVYDRLLELIQAHRSTLIFVNTRKLAERVSHRLREHFKELGEGNANGNGEALVAAHHGSLSRAIRLDAEQRLKDGRLKAIVATASLEMGIDIGYIDLVCQVGSPRSIATFLQRVGRSGHSLGLTPKGRLFPLTRDELVESMALVRVVRQGRLDAIEIPEAPLDILAQQIVATVACDEWDERELLALLRRAWPYRNLSDADYEAVLTILSEGLTPTTRRGAYLHRDRINGKLRARKSARLAAITSGGAIPETAEYRVVAEPERTFVGTLDEDFAIESNAGDIFLLGNTSWRVQYVRGGEVVVRDAGGAPPTIPFWFGEAPGRTVELSEEISALREELARDQRSEARVQERSLVPTLRVGTQYPGTLGVAPRQVPELATATQSVELSRYEAEPRNENDTSHLQLSTSDFQPPTSDLCCEFGPRVAEQASHYVQSQLAAVGFVPTQREILFERFFDESGGMQLVIHSPLGARINRAWGLALRKRFCRSFDFELQAAATDNGIVLSIGPQHSFPIESLFTMLGPHNGRYLLEQALLAAPMFQVRWRWNVTRALAVLRFQGGKKTPPHLQRFRSDDLLAAAFPETVGCLENHHGDVEIPDHPLVRQTMHDCLTEAMDVGRWLALLEDVRAGRVKLIDRDTREPSPFSYELLNAQPYAFLDDAPLEERRTRAVATRRSFTPDDVRDLARLDPEAIDQVRREAWPVVRSADELHDALLSMVLARESVCGEWSSWFNELVASGRASEVPADGDRRFWIAAESWPIVRAILPGAKAHPAVRLPAELDREIDRAAAIVALVRGQMSVRGPVTAGELAADLGLDESSVAAALEALEGQGIVLRGHFQPDRLAGSAEPSPPGTAAPTREWCDRRLLARIHRLTLDGLRRRVQPVSPEAFIRFLVRHHRLEPDNQWGGQVGVREAVAQLQGFVAPAGAWEESLLAKRVAQYDEAWLDQLFLTGEVAWGRLRAAHRPKGSDRDNSRNGVSITRTVPISMVVRSDLAWLVDQGGGSQEADAKPSLSSAAQATLEALTTRGALFFQELAAVTGLLPTQLEEALRELAGSGLATSDGFAAIRGLLGAKKTHRPRRHRRPPTKTLGTHGGRWSRFPGYLGPPPPREEQVQNWCRQLLLRYGVVFRDLLTREPAAPPWRELASALRQMELRGQVRGGRFISGVAGEQFADEETIERLRAVRDGSDDQWIVISAADPLNLAGIITPGPRVPATHKNALALKGGRCIAAKEANHVEFFEEFDTVTMAEIRRALFTVRREAASHIRRAWSDKEYAPRRTDTVHPEIPSQTMRRL